MSEQIHGHFRCCAALAVRTGVCARIRVAGFPVAVVVAAVVVVTLLAACSDTTVSPPPAPSAADAEASLFGPTENLYFDVGSSRLPVDSADVLAWVAESARANGGVAVLISAFHDAAGDAAANAELSAQRALTVRHALEANGVPPERLLIAKPAPAASGAQTKDGRRVELRLQ